jgi:hypothetical protein
MVMYRVSYIDQHDTCRIGLENESALPLLVYDTIFSNYAIAVFVWPLCKNRHVATSSDLVAMAHRNAVGSVVSTISSFLNIFSLFHLKSQRAEGCLLFCTFDVMVNVLVMNYLISKGKKKVSSKLPDEPSNSSFSYYATDFTPGGTKPDSGRIHPETPSNTMTLTSLNECRTEGEDDMALVSNDCTGDAAA